jgi:IS30 family transposase
LSDSQRDEIERRIAAGEPQQEVGAAVGCDPRTVIRWLTRTGGIRGYERRRSERALSLAEREEIALGVGCGESAAVIARRLGRAVSTVTRELARNGGRRGYRAVGADARALERARRPKLAKLARSPRLRAEVERRLRERWSPQQIAARLRLDFPDDPEMRVSHETIYQSLYVQSRGALRRELAGQLRLGRSRRRSKGVRPGGGLREIVPIAERPPEVDDRAVPGHWEGDLILGKAGRSAIATLVERQTRFAMLVELPQGRNAESVRVALTESIQRLPEALRRTLTWDQGKEMAEHARFTIDSNVRVYFCDPSSPWQRGTSENTNGLLRQYFPKGDDLAHYDQHHLDEVADELNGRPRQTLNWMKPSEAFDQLIATTA